VDYYIPTTTGLSWSTLTLNQWDNFTLSQWDALPLDSTSIQTGSYSLSYSATGNRTTHTDPVSGGLTTYTYGDAKQLLTAPLRMGSGPMLRTQ
jgi:hypothetical protein